MNNPIFFFHKLKTFRLCVVQTRGLAYIIKKLLAKNIEFGCDSSRRRHEAS